MKIPGAKILRFPLKVEINNDSKWGNGFIYFFVCNIGGLADDALTFDGETGLLAAQHLPSPAFPVPLLVTWTCQSKKTWGFCPLGCWC